MNYKTTFPMIPYSQTKKNTFNISILCSGVEWLQWALIWHRVRVYKQILEQQWSIGSDLWKTFSEFIFKFSAFGSFKAHKSRIDSFSVPLYSIFKKKSLREGVHGAPGGKALLLWNWQRIRACGVCGMTLQWPLFGRAPSRGAMLPTLGVII